MGHNFEILKTREDALNRLAEMLGVERETTSGYATRDELVAMLFAVAELKERAER